MKLNMMILFALLALLGSAAAAADPSDVLGAYDKVSQALVADNLDAAQKAGSELAAKADANSELAKHAGELAKSTSLDTAREHFKAVSQEAIKLAADKQDYHVMTCPMAKADWLQKDTKVANPYMGAKMPGCGSVKK